MLHRIAVRRVVLCLWSCALLSPMVQAQKIDLSFLVGASKVPTTDLSVPGGNTQKELSSTTFAWQVNAGLRVFKTGPISTFLELPFTGVPSQKFREIDIVKDRPGNGGFATIPADSAYFFTPGFRFRFLDGRFSPYAAAGFGFERATQLNATQITAVSTTISSSRNYKGAFDVGGGLDIGLHRHFALRMEFRDYVRTGEFVSESRHNLMAMGGGVFRF